MNYEGALMDRGPEEGYYCHQCTWGDRAGAKRLWDFGKLLDHATSIRPHNHSGPKLMKYLNEAPYVQRTPNTGNSGVGQPAIPTENFIVLEENGHVGFKKMSAAVMEAKPKHIRHTVLTKSRMPRLEDMPTYIQRFAHEIRCKPQSRDTGPRETDLDLDWIYADARAKGTRNQQIPKERLAVNSCNIASIKYDNCEVSAMQPKKELDMPSTGKSHLRTGSTHGKEDFEYRIKYDIVPTDGAYMMPPITMASGQVPRMEAVMGCTTVRFCQVGVTKAFLPPGYDS